MEDPHFKAPTTFVTADPGLDGTMSAPTPRLSDRRAPSAGRPPLGAHNREVYAGELACPTPNRETKADGVI